MSGLANLFNTVMSPIYNGVSWILLQWHSFWSLFLDPASGAAWALSIVMLVVMIRIALIPLFVKQIKATRGLQTLQPQMKEIQTKYKNDRQKQSEEMMKLYKETGTNPLSSCLPILVQSPFFFALFHVLQGVAKGVPVGVLTLQEVQQGQSATILGAPISASFVNAPNMDTKIVAAVLIVLMTATTFTTQRQLMVKNQPLGQSNPMMQQQKILLYVMPGMFAVFGINFPIGVLIYWLTTNLWTMGQQLYVIRRNPTPGSEAEKELIRRKAEKAAARGEIALPTGTTATVVDEEPKAVRTQPKRQPRAKRTPPPPPKPNQPKPPGEISGEPEAPTA